MKRFLSYLLAFVVVAGAGIYLFREPLKDALYARITADMFVPRDDDAYDPGAAIGTALPALRARYQGREITQLAEFGGANGMVLFVNRSVDW
jgi:hypothetical protein